MLKKYKLRSKFEIKIENDLQIAASFDEKVECLFEFEDKRSPVIGKRFCIKNQEEDNSLQYDDFLVKNLIPAGEWLEQNKSFILEYNFEAMNAIDFNKGCYIGQELITRTKRTGEIRKKLEIVDKIKEDDKIIKSTTNQDLFLVLQRI